MSYDSWKTTTPQDREHVEECNCPECHECHDIKQFSKYDDYVCCQNAMDEMIRLGDWCERCDTDAYLKDGRCYNHGLETVGIKTVCGWCKRFMSGNENSEYISNGICDDCKIRVNEIEFNWRQVCED